jgi:hypothetical protein
MVQFPVKIFVLLSPAVKRQVILLRRLAYTHRDGLQQRKNSWQDGVSGTNCPIPPGQNFTYRMQAKDQIGSFFYFPSLAFHKAAGGFGAIRIRSRPLIPVPFPLPADEYTMLIGDWYGSSHKVYIFFSIIIFIHKQRLHV